MSDFLPAESVPGLPKLLGSDLAPRDAADLPAESVPSLPKLLESDRAPRDAADVARLYFLFVPYGFSSHLHVWFQLYYWITGDRAGTSEENWKKVVNTRSDKAIAYLIGKGEVVVINADEEEDHEVAQVRALYTRDAFLQNPGKLELPLRAYAETLRARWTKASGKVFAPIYTTPQGRSRFYDIDVAQKSEPKTQYLSLASVFLTRTRKLLYENRPFESWRLLWEDDVTGAPRIRAEVMEGQCRVGIVVDSPNRWSGKTLAFLQDFMDLPCHDFDRYDLISPEL